MKKSENDRDHSGMGNIQKENTGASVSGTESISRLVEEYRPLVFAIAARFHGLEFDDLVQEKTAVYISHRMSSCRFCNNIFVFEDGKIVQKGSHDSLMREEEGLYSRLWNAQAQYYC